VLGLRGVVLVAVIVAAFALYDMTRAHNPALALAMGIVNPLVLSIVGWHPQRRRGWSRS